MQNTNIFSNLHPTELEKLLASHRTISHLDINNEDSPVSIDAMVSVQNGKLMFVSSVKIGTLAGLLETEDPRLNLEQRRQRKPDFKRIPKMSEYLHGNPWAYSAITVALSGAFEFDSIETSDNNKSRLGTLKIPRGFKTRAVIIDGQHRFLSLRSALGLEANYSRYALPYEEQKILAEENIAVIFYAFADDQQGVEWSQQYFHDLNCLGVSTSRSLGVKFDKRTPINILTTRISQRANPFVGRIEEEQNQCGSANNNLFTLSALKNANRYLLEDVTQENLAEKYDEALEFWNNIGEIFQDWSALPGYEIRDRFIHGYGVTLSALGVLGRQLFITNPDNYNQLLPRLKGLDWSKWKLREDGSVVTTDDGKRVGNPKWNGFAMNGATVQNTSTTIRHTSLLFKKTIGLELTEEEEVIFDSVQAAPEA